MSAFAAVVVALFADPNIGRDAVYIADGGAPVLVRIVARRADTVTEFGDARLWSETTRIDLRVAEVASPRPGDRIEIDGDVFLIQGEPVRDRERLVWTVRTAIKDHRGPPYSPPSSPRSAPAPRREPAPHPAPSPAASAT